MSFEAVFYSEPVPSSFETLTLLALVFDRIHFPGVYIPSQGVDAEGALRELDRISEFEMRRPEHAQMRNAILYAAHIEHVKTFCLFNGKPGYPGIMEEGANDLAKELEIGIFGPPPEGFFPSFAGGWAKGLPGDKDAAVNAPGWITYPASAVLYAMRRGLVLVNDNPQLPVPSIGTATVKSDAAALAGTLALEAVRLTLPAIQMSSFAEIAELRSEVEEFAPPFRREMLRLSRELNQALLSDATVADVQREARFLVETSVMPSLKEYAEKLREPKRPWHRRLFDAAKATPGLVANFATLPKSIATAKVLAALGSVLADVRDDQLEAEGYGKRTGLHYLLKVAERAPRGRDV